MTFAGIVVTTVYLPLRLAVAQFSCILLHVIYPTLLCCGLSVCILVTLLESCFLPYLCFLNIYICRYKSIQLQWVLDCVEEKENELCPSVMTAVSFWP